MSAGPIQPVSFIAVSAEEAVAKIRAQLGSEAIVVNVRPLPATGLNRLWQRPLIEVLAYRPEPEPPPPASPTAEISETLAAFRQELEQIRAQVEGGMGPNRISALLQKTGMLPQHAQTIVDRMKSAHGDAPATLGEELARVRAALERMWRPAEALAEPSVHALIGPPGSGKTTCVCKWLTQASMVEGRLATVWRLDGMTANMAESLSVHCEILGVACERSWTDGPLRSDIGFIDLPGVDWRQPSALEELAGQLPANRGARLHLVLNAAYDAPILLSQVRAFSTLPIDDLILTHLDEETRWGKIWNLALGTNYPIRFLSAGLNIPGDFCPAMAELILARQFSRK